MTKQIYFKFLIYLFSGVLSLFFLCHIAFAKKSNPTKKTITISMAASLKPLESITDFIETFYREALIPNGYEVKFKNVTGKRALNLLANNQSNVEAGRIKSWALKEENITKTNSPLFAGEIVHIYRKPFDNQTISFKEIIKKDVYIGYPKGLVVIENLLKNRKKNLAFKDINQMIGLIQTGRISHFVSTLAEVFELQEKISLLDSKDIGMRTILQKVEAFPHVSKNNPKLLKILNDVIEDPIKMKNIISKTKLYSFAYNNKKSPFIRRVFYSICLCKDLFKEADWK